MNQNSIRPNLKLQDVFDSKILEFKEDIEEVTEGADKQLQIETKLGDIKAQWSQNAFSFVTWKDRGCEVRRGGTDFSCSHPKARPICLCLLMPTHPFPILRCSRVSCW